MKKIYILRHAKAEKTDKKNDFERELNEKGKEDIQKLLLRLKKHSINLDLILSSPAYRTLQSAKRIAKAFHLKDENLLFKKQIYECNYKDLFDLIKKVDDRFKELCIVGHNPALRELCEFLSSICINSFPTSSMLCLEFNTTTFKDIREHSGKVIFFEHIKALKS